MNTAHIYRITNLVNGKMYIGFTSVNPDKRFIKHKYEATGACRMPIARAIRKYGLENFLFDIIYCSDDVKHCLEVMEPYFINHYDTLKHGYNAHTGGKAQLGRKCSIETKEKMRIKALQIGNKPSKEALNKSIISNSKKWKIIFRDGHEEIIINLRLFCETHKLDRRTMQRVSDNIFIQHHGFKCSKVER